jgi:hypothetical protein
MAANMATMTLDIARLCGKLEMAALIQAQEKQTCDRRHSENQDRFKDLQREMQELRA